MLTVQFLCPSLYPFSLQPSSLLWTYHSSYLYRLLPTSFSLAISFLFHFLHSLALVLSFPCHSCLAADLSPFSLIVVFLSKYHPSLQTPYISFLAIQQTLIISSSSCPPPSTFLPPLLVPDLHPPCDHPSRVQAICSFRRTKCVLLPQHQPGYVCLGMCGPVRVCVC